MKISFTKKPEIKLNFFYKESKSNKTKKNPGRCEERGWGCA